VEMLVKAGIPATLSQDTSIFTDDRAARYDVALWYTSQKALTPKEQEGLAAYVAGGKGLLALHTATVLEMPDHDTYNALVGGRFLGHDEFGRFHVTIAGEHPITAGVPDFDIDDELYIVEPLGEPGQVLATGASEKTPAKPMLTLREYGKGHVCYLALGHDGRAWAHPCFKQLVVQATQWLMGTSKT
jgi:uncharacterized protein